MVRATKTNSLRLGGPGSRTGATGYNFVTTGSTCTSTASVEMTNTCHYPDSVFGIRAELFLPSIAPISPSFPNCPTFPGVASPLPCTLVYHHRPRERRPASERRLRSKAPPRGRRTNEAKGRGTTRSMDA